MAAEKDVKYDLIPVDELPPQEHQRTSELEQQLERIKSDPALHAKAFCIAQYRVSTAATGSANILRKRHGQPEANGWWFGTRVAPNGDGRRGLYAMYDPSKIVPGEAEKHQAEKAAYDKAAREKRQAKAKEAKAKAGAKK